MVFDLGEVEAAAALGVAKYTAVRAALGLDLHGSTALAIEVALARIAPS